MTDRPDQISIRRARPDDAGDLARMTADLNRHVGLGEPEYGERELLEHGFGAEQAYSALIAEAGGRTVGYAIYCAMFNTDFGKPGLWLCDLFVDADWRGTGVGKRLFQTVARLGRESGHVSVWWTAEAKDERALAFYRGIGGREYEDIRYFEMDGEAMDAVADGGEAVSD